MTELTEKQIHDIATAAARETNKQLFAVLGINPDDLDDMRRMRANLVWADKSRKLSEKLGGRIALTVVSVLTGAALLAAWETVAFKIGLR